MINYSIVMRGNPTDKTVAKSVRQCTVFGSDGHQPLCRAHRQPRLCVQACGHRGHPHHVRGLHAGAVAGRTKIQLGDLGVSTSASTAPARLLPRSSILPSMSES